MILRLISIIILETNNTRNNNKMISIIKIIIAIMIVTMIITKNYNNEYISLITRQRFSTEDKLVQMQTKTTCLYTTNTTHIVFLNLYKRFSSLELSLS